MGMRLEFGRDTGNVIPTVTQLSSMTIRQIVQGSRYAGRTHNYSIVRLAALEARAMKRASLTSVLYLPIIFFGYGFLLGMQYRINYQSCCFITMVICCKKNNVLQEAIFPLRNFSYNAHNPD